ncbi:hypothetical protein [Photobacterium halotolerans]|uniref:DUF1795 domain-containing protein n=1 Tax=Photobacterium halotolerans TaxID=265726 RepID=A0A0F5VCG8_9GAMM|nr:hypothetical protein [Photobacterium halotolerans]KKC99496.1 hypothetical protein KY46_12675 [Photobacterium halotolerans]
MNRIYIFALIFLSFSSYSKEINIPETEIYFDAPNDFMPLTQEEIDQKWIIRKNPPRWALGNENSSTTIAYDYREGDFSNITLPALINYMKINMGKVVAGVEWIKTDVVHISGKEWAFLEMTTSALDTDIHNIILMTKYKKGVLIFNFNSTKSDFIKYESTLRDSIKSIRL